MEQAIGLVGFKGTRDLAALQVLSLPLLPRLPSTWPPHPHIHITLTQNVKYTIQSKV